MNKNLSNVPSAGTKDKKRTAADESRSASVEANPMLADAVQEGNKLIAEFMSFKSKKTDYYKIPKKIEFQFDVDSGYIMKHASNLEFNKYWNWLIPAWAKFCDKSLEFLPSLKNKVGFEKEVKFYVVQKGKFEKAVHSNNCSLAFEILVESIKWYNAEKNKSA